MNPLQQIADNLAALNSDAPERADAVIKLTNMAKAEPVAWHITDGDAVSLSTRKIEADVWASDPSYTVTPLYAHPSRGVVDEALAGRLEEISDSFDGAYEGWEKDRSDLYRAAAILRQAAALPAVPEGWVLVPREPTEAMLEAAMQREDDEPLSDWGKLVPAPHAEIYAAMLAATPAHDQPEGSDNG